MATNLDFNLHDVRRIKITDVRRLSTSGYQILEIEVFDADGCCVGELNFYSDAGQPLIVEQVEAKD